MRRLDAELCGELFRERAPDSASIRQKKAAGSGSELFEQPSQKSRLPRPGLAGEHGHSLVLLEGVAKRDRRGLLRLPEVIFRIVRELEGPFFQTKVKLITSISSLSDHRVTSIRLGIARARREPRRRENPQRIAHDGNAYTEQRNCHIGWIA